MSAVIKQTKQTTSPTGRSAATRLTDSLWSVMLRQIGRRPLQSVLFVLGVALGVAMIVGIDMANSSASRAFGLFTESITGRTTHQISAGPSGIPEDLYRQIRVELGWKQAAPVVTDYAQAQELSNQPLRIFGIDPFAESPFRGYLELGNAESNAQVGDISAFFVRPNTAFIAEPLAQTYGLKEGSTITLTYGTRKTSVTVIGLLRPTDSVTEEGLQDLLIVDISTAQELLGMVGKLTNIDLIFPQGAEGEAALQRVEAVLPPGVVLQTASARNNAVVQMTDAFNLSLTALSLLALVVGMFLIYNTVMFSVVQRRPTIGTLRALGVTRGQIFSMLLWEAALLGAIGALLGLVLGVILGRLAVILVTQTVSSLYFTVTVRNVAIPIESLLKGAAIGIAAALSAALLPAFEATTTPPLGALKRSSIEAKVRAAIPALTVAGIILIVISLIALPTASLPIMFAGLFGIVIGFSLLTPIVTLYFMRAIRPLTGAAAGILGLMAPRSITRSLSRTSVAIAALMVAVSVIVGVSAMVGSFRVNVQKWLQNTLQADILINPPSVSANRITVPVDPGVADLVRNTPGIREVGVARNVEVIRPGDALPVYLSAFDKDTSDGDREFVWSIGDYDTVFAAMGEGAVIISETFARKRGLPIGAGGVLTLLTDKGERQFPVAAVQYDYAGDQGSVLIRMEVYRSLWNDTAISTLAAYVTPDANIDTVVQTLRDKFAGIQELQVRSNRELLDGVLVIFDQTFAITTALNLLATIVAFIGILSALAALQLERTREIGTMRANGLTRRQLFRMTLIETGLMGVTAGLMAVPVGTVLAWVLVYIINIRSFGWSMQLLLRPEFYSQALGVALIAALLAGIYPALRIGSILPARAVRSE